MAEVTITASAVAPVVAPTANPTLTEQRVAGATIAAGQWVYLDTANSNVAKLAQSDGTVLEAAVAGMALNSASTGQPVTIAIGGTVTVGSVVAAGVFYFLSSTAGNMELFTDVASTEKESLLCYAISATVIYILIRNTELAKT